MLGLNSELTISVSYKVPVSVRGVRQRHVLIKYKAIANPSNSRVLKVKVEPMLRLARTPRCDSPLPELVRVSCLISFELTFPSTEVGFGCKSLEPSFFSLTIRMNFLEFRLKNES